MQLKTIGESLHALADIQDILTNSYKNTKTLNNSLINNLKQYSTEAIKTALAQSKKLTTSQIQAILSSKGLEGNTLKTAIEEIEQLSTSQDKATFTAKDRKSVV